MSRGDKVKSKTIIEPEDDEDSQDGEDLKKDEKSAGGFVEDDDDDEEEEEEEDEAAAAAEFNDFIDQGQEQEEEEGDEAGEKSDASSSNDEATDVDEDDLELLKDNLNVDNLEEIGIKRQKRKRIIVQSESEEEPDEPREKKKIAERQKQQQQSSKEKKKKREEAAVAKSHRRHRDDDDLGDEEPEDGEDLENIDDDDDRDEDARDAANQQSDEEGSFIVDDSDDDDDQAEGINKDRARALKKKKRQRNGYNDEAQQEAMDIFGVDADELVAQIDENDQDQGENEYEDDDDEDDEYYSGEDELLDEEGRLLSRSRKQQAKRQQKAATHTKLEDIFEPEELEKNLMTERDQLIRMEDKPERYMTRGVPVTSEPDETELEREAEWIHAQAFSAIPTISNQEQTPFKESRVIVKIKDVLNFIRNEFLEVPFIANYRKEYIQPDLSVDDLWKIYEMDEKYCQLKARKENFQKLYERMQRYQTAQVEQWRQRRAELEESGTEESLEDLAAINKALDMIRPIEQSDIDRVRAVQTVEEFLDCYQHFQLYYSVDLIPMKEYEFDQRQANKGDKRTKKVVKKIVRRVVRRETTDDMEEGENPEEEEEEIEVEEEVEVEEGDEDEDDGGEDEVKLTKYALPKRDRYHQFKLAGLLELARKFGLTPEQYGENLHADYQKNEVEQCEVEPRVLAQDHCREPYFTEPDQVLTAVRYMVAVELAREPSVRSSVRDHYYKHVAVSVRPTMPRGYSTIDEDHPCYTLKYLKNKPCRDLVEDQYLKLHLAEQDELIKMEFKVLDLETLTASKSSEKLNGGDVSISGGNGGGGGGDDDDDWDTPASSSKPLPSKSQPAPATTSSMFRTVDEKLKSFYQKDEFSYNVEQWNTQRSLIIDEMLHTYLYPEFEREVRGKLLREAKQFVFKQSATRLRNIIRVAPYAPATLDEEDEGLRVLVFVYAASAADRNAENGDDMQLGVCACVNSDGELDEFLWLKHLQSRGRFGQGDNNDHPINSFVAQQRRDKNKEMRRIEEFMIDKRPKLIVVSGESRDAQNICDDLNELLRQMRESGGDQVGSLGNVHVEIVDPEVGKLLESSKSCQVNFAPVVAKNSAVKQAISLARAVQDPLLCYSQLVNMDRDILSLKLHPLMPLLVTSRESEDASQLLRLLEIEFINCANEVGVDLNRCNQQPHTSNVLQFVSGFGMRKAQHLLRLLRQERLALKGKLPSDKQFKTYPVAKNRVSMVSKYQLGARLFINSAGFIKFDVDYIKREIDEEEDEDEDDEERRERRRRGQSSQGDEDDDFTEPLDSTRIHPESYEWAEKMCVDALDVDEDGGDNGDDETGGGHHRRANSNINAKKAVKEIMENPKRLKDLDLDAFAEELLRTGHGNKITTLNEIRQELNYRYRDKRTPFRSLDANEKFYLLLKETEQTFRVGKLVACKCINIARRRPNKEQLDEANPIKDDNTFMWQCSFCKRNDFSELAKVWSHFDTGECPGPAVGVRTILENNCPGFVSLKFLSDQHVTNPDERVKVGLVFNARIKSIDTEKGRVDLTSRSSDLRDVNEEWKPRKDRYYDYASQREDDEKINEKKRKEEHKSTYTKRVIAHPQFKNVDYHKVVQMLKDMNVGDCIFRPSSRGADHLTVTWKIWNDCYGNVDILEEKKVNAFSLGKRLIIDGEDYEDLDEIIARYISPMASNVKEILSHKNFCDLNQLDPDYTAVNTSARPSNDPASMKPSQQEMDLIEKHFREEKMKNPSRIPYSMVCCHGRPGRFFLFYSIKSTKPPRWEYIKVLNDGFTFRDRKFTSLNELITWFKTHYNEPFTNISNKPPQSISGGNNSSSQPPSSSADISNQMNQMSFLSNTGAGGYNNNTSNNNNDDWDDVPMVAATNSGPASMPSQSSTFDRLLGSDRRPPSSSNDQQNWNTRDSGGGGFDNQSQGWRGRGGGGGGGSREGGASRPSRFSNNYNNNNNNWDQDNRPSRGGRGGGGGGGRPFRGRGGGYGGGYGGGGGYNGDGGNGGGGYRAPAAYNNGNNTNDDESWDDISVSNKMDTSSSQKTSRFDDNWTSSRPQNSTNDRFGGGSGGNQYNNSNNISAAPPAPAPAPINRAPVVDEENWD